MKNYGAANILNMIIHAEETGGSHEAIIDAVRQWDSQATTVEINDRGIIVDGKPLDGEEIETWFWWTQGINRKGEETRIRK